MDIESAFADGPFGSGVKPEPKQPEQTEQPETTTEQRDAGGDAEPVAAKADSKDAGARDERDDGDDESPVEGPPGSEGLQKALKSERSLRREQRKALSDALKRSEQFEAQLRQQAAQIAAMQQQAAAAQPQTPQKKDEPPDFFADPEGFAKRVAEEKAKEAFAAVAPQLAHVRSQYISQAEQLYVQAKPEARVSIDRFVALAKSDPRVMAEYVAVRDGTHPLAAQDPTYSNPVLFADAMGQSLMTVDEITKAGGLDGWKKSEREKWEAEQASKQAAQDPRAALGERRAPLTLAGRRGGGSSVTPASTGPVSVEQAFRF